MKGVFPTTGMKWHWSPHPDNLKKCAIYAENMGKRNKTAKKSKQVKQEIIQGLRWDFEKFQEMRHQNIPRNSFVICAKERPHRALLFS
jgi:hypothetical protein